MNDNDKENVDNAHERDPGSAFFYMVACAIGKFLNAVMLDPADTEDAVGDRSPISPLKSTNPLYCAVHGEDKSNDA